MMLFKRTAIFSWLIAVFALAPAALFAYLGQFSRLMFDDYFQVALPKQLGAWDYMVHQLNIWSGGYASWFFKGLAAPLDTLLPRITPTLIIVLWLVGLSWLVFQGLTYLKVDRSRLPLSVAAAALTVAASINSFYSPQSLYWYAASTHHTLPLAVLAIYFPLALWLARRQRRDSWSLLGIIAGAALCFITAGSSEIFAAFQAAFFTFCLLALFALPPARRRPYALVFGMGWLATLAGLVIQLNVPGPALRAAYISQTYGQIDRSISVLIYETVARSVSYISHPQAIAGFVMLMAVGLLVMLVKYKPHSASKAAPSVKFALPPLWLGLIFQLLWMPLLWLQISDSPQWLGRFSSRYMVVVILNVLFILGFMVLLWQRKRVYAQLQRRGRGRLIIGHIIGLALIFALLFLSAQVNRSIDRRSAAYLLMSLLTFLIVLTWHLLYMVPSAAARRFGWLALCSYSIGWACIAVVVFVSMYGAGHVQPRALAAGAYLLVAPGLLWGAWIGVLLKHDLLSSRSGQTGAKLLKLGCLVIVLVGAVGIVLGQAALLPKFQLYAGEWDARHQEIITLRDSGQDHIETTPLTWNLADYAAITTLTDLTADSAPRYYEVKSITVTDD